MIRFSELCPHADILQTVSAILGRSHIAQLIEETPIVAPLAQQLTWTNIVELPTIAEHRDSLATGENIDAVVTPPTLDQRASSVVLNCFRTVQFAELIPDGEIVQTLSAQLG